MKKPLKSRWFLPWSLLLSLFVVVVVLVNSAWYPRHESNHHLQGPNAGIPLDTFKNRLVKASVVWDNKAKLTKMYKIPFNGAVLRSADVLLSLGLNSDSLFKYVTCEKIRLKITLGYNDTAKDPVNKIKFYAHPVLIDDSGNVAADLYFDQNGNLYQYNSNSPNQKPILFVPNSSCNTQKQFGPKMIATVMPAAPVTASGLYAIDLNNPCPPCSP